MKIFFTVALSVFAMSAHAAKAGECSVAETPEHWISEYCLYKDRASASACIAEEKKINFRSNCTARLHFKRSLCELAIARGQRAGSTDACVGDGSFVSPGHNAQPGTQPEVPETAGHSG